MIYIYLKKMQKKFVIIDDNRLLNNLIEEQVSIVFKKNFNVKFIKIQDINSVYEP